MSKGSKRRRENTAQYNEFYKKVKWPNQMTNKQWRNIWYGISDFVKLKQGEKDAT
tara:strand:+ start:331 stop:495 length:165 start_codon:yes stop_codon:yes gene_type:complete